MVTAQQQRDQADYNYEHFRAKNILTEIAWSGEGKGVQPGSEAPEFELESVDGGRVRLSGLRGRPVLLHFGSIT